MEQLTFAFLSNSTGSTVQLQTAIFKKTTGSQFRVILPTKELTMYHFTLTNKLFHFEIHLKFWTYR